MKQIIPSLVLMVSVGLSILSGCSKPVSEKSEGEGQTKQATPEKAPSAPAKIERSALPALNRPSKKAPLAPETGVLENDYRATTNEVTKSEIIYNLGEVGSREAVVALGRLFQFEKDVELKTEMLSILSVVDGADTEKLAVYKLGVKAGQPLDVRKEAIDGLSDIEDPRVVPILQELTKDPDSEISDAAREALEFVQSTMLTQ